MRSNPSRESWATAGLDLHVEIDRSRIRASLESALREAVRSGRLASGMVLPSSRALAVDLNVARNTVVEVYSGLVNEGWLVARSGSATVVADLADQAHPAAVCEPAVVGTYPVLAPCDLRPGWPNLSSFPRQGWLRAAQTAIRLAPTDAFGYCEPRGRPELRTVLAGYLARARGLHVSPDQIVVCAGTTQGVQLVGQALRARGAMQWAIESHGMWVHRDVARSLGFGLQYLPVDANGVVMSDHVVADVLMLTPAHQFPLGSTLSSERRRRMAEWAQSTGAVIIEDDYDGEFRYDRRPLSALQSFAPDHVVYAGSVSKTLAPGLRLGWLVVPPWLLGDVAVAKSLAAGHNSNLDQLILAEYVRSGGYDRHIRRSRLTYRRRRDQLVAAMSGVPGVVVMGADAGLHALVTLPSGVDEDSVIAHAQTYDLTLEGLGTYTHATSPHQPPALVIGYATPTDHYYPEALHRLTAVLASAQLR